MSKKSCGTEQKILRRNCLILTLRASRKSLLETRLSLPQIYTIWQTKVFLSSPSKWLLLMTQYFDEEQTGFGNNFERKPSSISSLSHSSLKWFLHFFQDEKRNSDSVQQFSRIIQSNGGTIIIQDDPDLERWKKDHFFPLYSRITSWYFVRQNLLKS